MSSVIWSRSISIVGFYGGGWELRARCDLIGLLAVSGPAGMITPALRPRLITFKENFD
jgi:hypothetical protein